MNSNTSKTSSATSPKLILIGLVAALVIAAILYGVGLSKGRGQLASQKAGYETQIQTLQKELGTTRTELALAQNRSRLFEARITLYRTALDLEQRNFGTANTHLQQSAALLSEVGKEAGMDMGKLNSLQKSIAKTDINVAVDLESQRQQVLTFASQLESLMPVTETSLVTSAVTGPEIDPANEPINESVTEPTTASDN